LLIGFWDEVKSKKNTDNLGVVSIQEISIKINMESHIIEGKKSRTNYKVLGETWVSLKIYN